MLWAIARGVPDSFTEALCAAPPETRIDLALARSQHAAYLEALRACGAAVEVLPADDAHPDCVFVEDLAVLAGDTALITRPGAPSRRGEAAAVAAALARSYRVVVMSGRATLDGGDCMRVGRTLYVGRSARTNAEGIDQLARAFPQLRVVAVDLPAGVLHLKCVCSPLGPDRILLAEDSVAIEGVSAISIPAAESYAANVVAIGAQVIVAEGFPRTHEALGKAGFTVHTVPASEVRKADGSLTCQSIIAGLG